MKILHVCESFGGGVTSAINSYVNATLGEEHYLLASIRENDKTGEEQKGNFQKIFLTKRNFNFIFKLNSVYGEIKPDVVHIHSTFAGLLVRVFSLIPSHKIAYTPHAYSFLRNDGTFKTTIYRLIERILSFRTAMIIACGKSEANIARKLSSKYSVENIVNVSDINVANYKSLSTKKTISDRKVRIGMVGRISAQKGFINFASLAKSCPDFEFIWIGGGAECDQKFLESNGVLVTGWLSRDDVLKELNSIDIYFHCALWEGFPISVIEAANLNKPVMLWSIPAFVDEGLNVENSLKDCRKTLLDFSNDKTTFLNSNRDYIIKNNTFENLQSKLSNAYRKLYSANQKSS